MARKKIEDGIREEVRRNIKANELIDQLTSVILVCARCRKIKSGVVHIC